MEKIVCMFSMIALLTVPEAAQAIGIEAAVGGWDQDVQGEMSYKAIDAQRDTLDFEKDLKLEDETRATGRVKIDMPLILPNVYLMYTPMEFKGMGEKEVDFDFGDQTFTGNIPIKSTVAMNHLDVGLFYSIPLLKMASFNKLNIDLGLNVKVADLEAEVQELETDKKYSKSYNTLPIPMVYAGIQLNPIENFSFEVEGRGVSYEGNHLYNLLGRIKFKIAGPLFIASGYRYDSIYLEKNNFMLDTSVEGVFAETGFEF